MIQDLIEKELGSSEYTRGDEHAHYCPKCNWKNPRLMVNYQEDKFHCWYCGWGGASTIGILYKMGVDKSIIMQAQRELGIAVKFQNKGNYDVSVSDRVKNTFHLSELEETESYFNIPPNYQPLYKNRKKFKSAYKYLRKDRSLSQREIELYDFHYDPEESAILLPSYAQNGRVNYYISRKIKGGYDNLKESKFKHIFFESYIDFNDDINLTEGGFDAVSIGYNTIPMLGLRLSPKLIETLNLNKPPSITVYVDRSALYNSYHIAKQLYNQGHNVFIAHNNEYDDPNDTPRNIITETLARKRKVDTKFLIQCKIQNIYEMFSS
jgi:DNA primase